MGAIAMQGDETALKLFRKVLIASVSIPAAFPPVFVPVRHGGLIYDEMHVDGGASREVFLFPAATDLRFFETRRMRSLPKRLYIIRNAKLGPEWQAVDPNLLKIRQRSISTLIKYQGWGDLNRIYLQCRASGFDFNLASIPQSFNVEEREILEIPYRKALFEFGFEIARHGYPWRKYPPDLTPQQQRHPTRLLSSLLPD